MVRFYKFVAIICLILMFIFIGCLDSDPGFGSIICVIVCGFGVLGASRKVEEYDN